METKTRLHPIKKEDRIYFLKISRGIDILFIYVANTFYFSGYFFYPQESHIPTTNLVTDSFVDFTNFTLIDGKFYSIFSLLFGMGHAALLALTFKKGARFLNWFAPVRKASLSNYIFQTFISIAIFYGIGFNLIGKFGITVIMSIAILIFILQIFMSTWWLKLFRFGLLDWIWRQLTYGKN